MKKLFISQPMRGKSNEEILAIRSDATQAAKDAVGEEVEVIDSFFENAPVGAKPLWFLGKSLELLATADTVDPDGRFPPELGGAVARRVRRLDDPVIVGYGVEGTARVEDP